MKIFIAVRDDLEIDGQFEILSVHRSKETAEKAKEKQPKWDQPRFAVQEHELQD